MPPTTRPAHYDTTDARIDKITVNEGSDTTLYDSSDTERPAGFGRPIDDPELPGMAEKGTAVEVQSAQYEGLTVNFLELLYSAGGKVLSDDGKKSAINSPENLRALQFMVEGIRTGAAPSVVAFLDESTESAVDEV